MGRIRFRATSGRMSGVIDEVPGFPGDVFPVGLPEAIGDAEAPVWFSSLRPDWSDLGDGVHESWAGVEGELDYLLRVIAREDRVEIRILLYNRSPRRWERTLAFNCVKFGDSEALRDYECRRHRVRHAGGFARLDELPRAFGPRPTVQLFRVRGAPPPDDIPFVRSFRATHSEAPALEGWIAVESRDGRRLGAVVSRPALFLFQNLEYSCVHSAPGFGPLAPGESAEARTFLYLTESSLADWYARMRSELGDPLE